MDGFANQRRKNRDSAVCVQNPAGRAQMLEHPQPIVGGLWSDRFQVVDVATGLKLNFIIETSQHIPRIGPDLSASNAIAVDTVDVDERDAVRRPVMRLPGNSEVRKVGVCGL